MYDIEKCEKIEIEQGAFYLGESNKERSVGYLELKPCSSLPLHDRKGGIEHLTQVKGSCLMVVFDSPTGTNHKIDEGEQLSLEPEGVRHIHANPFDETSLTYWRFEGDIRHGIEGIRRSKK